MIPLTHLTEEHHVIRQVLQRLQNYAQGLERGANESPERLLEIMVFLREYWDAIHHAKEVDLLFESSYGPAETLLHDHDRLRLMARRLRDLAESASGRPWGRHERLAASQNIAIFLQAMHTQLRREEETLYPKALEHLVEDGLTRLKEKYTRAQEHHLESGTARRIAGAYEKITGERLQEL